MKAVMFLRIASVLTLIHAIFHTFGAVFGKPVSSAATLVAAAMQEQHFPVFGVSRSYGDFYFGLGWCVTLFLVFSAVLLWQLSALMKDPVISLRPILAMFLVAFLGMGVISYRYFFFGPVVVEVSIVICLCIAILTAKPAKLPGAESSATLKAVAGGA